MDSRSDGRTTVFFVRALRAASILEHCDFTHFPNQAALEGFLQSGLRNRIGQIGGTGSPNTGELVPR